MGLLGVIVIPDSAPHCVDCDSLTMPMAVLIMVMCMVILVLVLVGIATRGITLVE